VTALKSLLFCYKVIQLVWKLFWLKAKEATVRFTFECLFTAVCLRGVTSKSHFTVIFCLCSPAHRPVLIVLLHRNLLHVASSSILFVRQQFRNTCRHAATISVVSCAHDQLQFIVLYPMLFVSRISDILSEVVDIEEWRLLGCYAVWLLLEPTFRRNLAPPSSG
jgi:hypothetical protein